MKIKLLSLKDLKRATYNPRIELKKDSKEYNDLLNSIDVFGYIEPIIVNNFNNVVIGGHQRLTILEDKGIEKVECSMVSIKDLNKEKSLNLILNKVSGLWDDDKLKIILNDLNNTDFIDKVGFSSDELSNYLDEINIDNFFTGEENKKKTNSIVEKKCPYCDGAINTSTWEKA